MFLQNSLCEGAWIKEPNSADSIAKFYYTHDHMYIIKSISETELKYFKTILVEYFFMFSIEINTVLVKYVGIYSYKDTRLIIQFNHVYQPGLNPIFEINGSKTERRVRLINSIQTFQRYEMCIVQLHI